MREAQILLPSVESHHFQLVRLAAVTREVDERPGRYHASDDVVVAEDDQGRGWRLDSLFAYADLSGTRSGMRRAEIARSLRCASGSPKRALDEPCQCCVLRRAARTRGKN